MDSDTTLIERFRLHGDETAFNQLVERHKRDAYRLAYRVAGNHEDAHDLAQEAFIRVYRSLERFRGDSSFRTWLYRIVMNLSLNHVKRARRHTDGHVAVEDVSLPVPARGLTSVLAEEERRRLSDAIERLPERQRRTLILKTYEELKYTEISAIRSEPPKRTSFTQSEVCAGSSVSGRPRPPRRPLRSSIPTG